ncbi:MAG: hypothetical protein LBJ73_04940 [Rickettsiales bacterium]|jgi:hypothetical protein|nr:hypothetical protein [Rickettsiales bacterium]
MKKAIQLGKIIIPAGVIPERHELETASSLAGMGKNIEFLSPVYAKGIFTPDLLMDGQYWEIKSPCGNSKRTVENNFRKAQKQSENIIFDLRRIGLDEKVAISKIKREFSLQHGNKIQRIMIITKDSKILDFH